MTIYIFRVTYVLIEEMEILYIVIHRDIKPVSIDCLYTYIIL